MAARKRKHKPMSAQPAEDEACRLRYERVAGTGVAKASGVVCRRLPPEEGKKKRSSKAGETGSTVPELEALAAELTAAGCEPVSLESASDYRRIWLVVPGPPGRTCRR